MAGGPKLVNLVFNLDEGPKVKIKTITFDGNEVASDGTLRKQMKTNKIKKFLPFFTSHGTYQEAKFEEDADRVMQYYLDRGYINAQVGTPELKFIEDSSNKKTRWVDVRIPVREGRRYRIGNLDFDGNTIVKTDALRPLFKLAPGEFYSHKEITKGFQKAQEMYGAVGYMEFTGYPEPKPRDAPNPAAPEAPAALAAEPRVRRAADRRPHAPDSGRQAVLRQPDRVRRQHHDARQRDPAGNAPLRERRLQQRGAEVQHPAAQSARLLQGARRPAEGRDGRQDELARTREWTCGCSSRSRTATS